MSDHREKIQHVFNMLAERERARLDFSLPRPIPRYPTPQHVFYSVANSLRHRASNRYSNILAYDRTAVTADEGEYLNANVVCDGKGSWWVASQASHVVRLCRWPCLR